MQHQEFKNAEQNGKIIIGIEPAIARRFFCDTNGEEAIELSGNKLITERYSIKLLMILEVLFAIVSIVLSVFAIKWFCLIFIPIYLLIWFKYKLRASMPNQKIGGVLFLTLIGIGLSIFFFDENKWLSSLFIFSPLTFLCSKLIYKASIAFLRSASIKYQKVYELLLDKGIFIKYL